MANRSANCLGVTSSARSIPPSENARTIRFVAAWALVGPLASRSANRIPFSCTVPSGTTRLTTPQRSSVSAS